MDEITYTAFLGWTRLASGRIEAILPHAKASMDGDRTNDTLLIFEDQTGKQVDFDMRGSMEEILGRVAPKPARTGPGRPRLGVTSREISLLPRHWEWLEKQPNGTSATLRRLVEEARKRDAGESFTRAAIDAKGRVMTALAGNLPGFEEAYRALYARDFARLEQWVRDWPQDVREYVLSMVPEGAS